MDYNYRKKKCKWHKYKPNQKLLSCLLLWKKINILWHSFEILIFKKHEKSLLCCHFCKHCFSCSSLIPAKCLYVSTISVAKHSIKRVGLCFLICFGYKLQDFLINSPASNTCVQSPGILVCQLQEHPYFALYFEMYFFIKTNCFPTCWYNFLSYFNISIKFTLSTIISTIKKW